MNYDPKSTALIFTSPQNDLLKPESVIWGLVKDTVTKNKVIEHLQQLKSAATKIGMPVFYSLLKFDDSDYLQWKHHSTIQNIMFDKKLLHADSKGAEVIPELTPTQRDIVLSPRKGFSAFWTTDLNIQLRQRNIQNIILAGMAANLCVEAHLRDAIEQGFNAYVVTDAVAATGDEALNAAYVNYGLHATAVVTTQSVVVSLTQTETVT